MYPHMKGRATAFHPPRLILSCHLVFCFPNFYILYLFFVSCGEWGNVAALRFRFILPPLRWFSFSCLRFSIFALLSLKRLCIIIRSDWARQQTIQHFTKRKKMEKRIKRQPDNEHRALLSTGRQRQVKTRLSQKGFFFFFFFWRRRRRLPAAASHHRLFHL